MSVAPCSNFARNPAVNSTVRRAQLESMAPVDHVPMIGKFTATTLPLVTAYHRCGKACGVRTPGNRAGLQ